MILTSRQQQANALLQTRAKHILLDGGSRSGKSAILVRAICTRAVKAKQSRHAILRHHFKDVKESIGMDTLPKVMAACFPQVAYTINKSDWCFTLPNRSEIWLAGLDDKDRTEKILGKEFATLMLNEASQIPYQSRNMALTRLSQLCTYEMDGEAKTLALKAYYDMNPPSKLHWGYQLFYLNRDPETKQPIDAGDYAKLTMNPRDNEANLAPGYIDDILGKMSGRMRRRFLEGLYGEVAPGALWTEELIDTHRTDDHPDLVRIVVAVDPSGSDETDNAENDEIGIVVAGLGTDGIGYLLEDITLKGGPKTWGGTATTAFDRWQADCIVAEVNYGGAMVKYVIETQPRDGTRARPFKMLRASRGKAVRAEPISALHEQGKIRLCGQFLRLEEELCAMTTHGYTGSNSPNRADAFVWAMSELFPGMTKEKPREKSAERGPMRSGSQGWLSA